MWSSSSNFSFFDACAMKLEKNIGKKINILLVAFLGVALLAASCTQPLSTPPGPTATALDSELLEIYSLQVTRTAEAAMEGEGGGEAAPPEPTSAPVVVTNTPEPEPEPTEIKVDKVKVPDVYTLQKGEHPFCIARRFDIDAVTLLNYNGLGMGGVFPTGMQLNIPSNAASFSGERSLLNHPTTYTVQAGDTLYTIACKFGDVAPEQIAQANGKGKNWSPSAGAKIKIP
jgi:nucleoid-associated protein YgaU